MKRPLILVIIFVVLIVLASLYYMFVLKNTILNVTLTSPRNTATYNAIDIVLQKPASVHIDYIEVKTGNRYRTSSTVKGLEHHLDLLVLKANTEYSFQIVLEGTISQKSKILSFKTREQSPWLQERKRIDSVASDSTALDNGMVMVCYARTPGYIAMIDAYGEIRWYWQVDDIGVRAATFTPKNTILAMLRPPAQDVIDDMPQDHAKILEENPRPQRRGRMGFAGGTAIVEIDMAGNILRRIDLKSQHEGDHRIIHHDIRMDKEGNIYTLYRPKKLYDLSPHGGLQNDTLGGDGVLVFNPDGKLSKEWNVWDYWDIEHDPYIDRFGYDRFHMNGLFLDEDGNYILSVPIEDQIWKVNASTGNIDWKLGRGGDFEMDTISYFSFQHSPYINENGDLIVFDNGLNDKRSRTLVYHLDTTHMIARTIMNVPLPESKYTSRMGNGTLLPNGKLLQTSSKTGSVMVTDPNGKVLWELVVDFAPYRAEYVPEEIWKEYFIHIK
ncbi:MAG: arylsulfotransferase family protein [Tannerellaceae bacterium]|nr:arylsulfotransferase family protein [Tannerellaceae bacterium]